MKKLEGNKLVALIISAGMTTTFLAACSINTDKLGQGISDLGNAFINETETEQTINSAPSETATETTVIEETTTTESTPAYVRSACSDFCLFRYEVEMDP